MSNQYFGPKKQCYIFITNKEGNWEFYSTSPSLIKAKKFMKEEMESYDIEYFTIIEGKEVYYVDRAHS